jgi:hypothetical protein
MKIHSAVLTCSMLAGLVALSVPALAQQKTVRACVDEWRANKVANQAKGITERAYVAQCRGKTAATEPATAPGTAPKPATATTTTTTPSWMAPFNARAAAPGANHFSTEAEAKGRCRSDTVVWANLGSRVYHFAGSKDYGNTKKGAYMCERDSTAEGMRAAKNETHP